MNVAVLVWLARERMGQGATWPGSYWPIRSWERIGTGAKRLGTRQCNNKRQIAHWTKYSILELQTTSFIIPQILCSNPHFLIDFVEYLNVSEPGYTNYRVGPTSS